MNLRTFEFKTEVAFPRGGLADAVDELSIDRELYSAIHANDVIRAPFALAFAAHFPRHASFATWIVRGAFPPVRTEEIAGDVSRMVRPSVFVTMKILNTDKSNLSHIAPMGSQRDVPN